MSIETKTKNKKALSFISKAEIRDHCTSISVPEGATLLRTKKGCVNFYEGQEPKGTQNVWIDVPEAVKEVCFPEYRPRSGSYGKPNFKE